MYKPDTVIYHKNCADGFTAAWAIWRRWPEANFMSYNYDDEPPTEVDPFIDGKHVLIVDFSFKKNVISYLSMSAKSIVILDHHKTSKAELDGILDVPEDHDRLIDAMKFGHKVFAHFNMNKSGARLAWEFAHSGLKVPRLINYVEDRDLWLWQLNNSREINDFIGSFDFDFIDWTDIAGTLETVSGLRSAVQIGQSLNRDKIKTIHSLLETNIHEGEIDGHKVMIANIPGHLASDTGNIICNLYVDTPFSATYYFDAYGRQKWSLRSNGFDVSEITKKFGGGGHQKAGGFTTEKILTL